MVVQTDKLKAAKSAETPVARPPKEKSPMETFSTPPHSPPHLSPTPKQKVRKNNNNPLTGTGNTTGSTSNKMAAVGGSGFAALADQMKQKQEVPATTSSTTSSNMSTTTTRDLSKLAFAAFWLVVCYHGYTNATSGFWFPCFLPRMLRWMKGISFPFADF